jgi:hypothetical protein
MIQQKIHSSFISEPKTKFKPLFTMVFTYVLTLKSTFTKCTSLSMNHFYSQHPE